MAAMAPDIMAAFECVSEAETESFLSWTFVFLS